MKQLYHFLLILPSFIISCLCAGMYICNFFNSLNYESYTILINNVTIVILYIVLYWKKYCNIKIYAITFVGLIFEIIVVGCCIYLITNFNQYSYNNKFFVVFIITITFYTLILNTILYIKYINESKLSTYNTDIHYNILNTKQILTNSNKPLINTHCNIQTISCDNHPLQE
jgi:hypothetical protein